MLVLGVFGGAFFRRRKPSSPPNEEPTLGNSKLGILPQPLAASRQLSDVEFRAITGELEKNLAANSGFRWTIFWRLALTLIALGVALLGLLGITIKQMADGEITEQKKKIDKEIVDKFKDENIKNTIQDAASTQASMLLGKIVQPTIDRFDQHLKDQQKTADDAISKFQGEIAKLEKRNEDLVLGDKAIGGGDVIAFRRLRALTSDPSDDVSGAANAEYIQVLQVYGPLGITWRGLTLSVTNGPDGKARTENDLGEADLLAAIGSPDAKVRFKVAQLLQNKGKAKSYSTAKTIETAIEKETNLLVMREMRSAFKHVVPDFTDQGSLDGQDVVEWWKIHEADVQKADAEKNSPAARKLDSVLPLSQDHRARFP